jgi:hypothetical protein
MKIKPLSPQDIKNDIENIIPDSIVKAVNNFLKRAFRGSMVCITQDEILEEIHLVDNTLTRKQIFDNNWLDFEPIFEKAGWKVVFYKSGYNEDFNAYFTFTPKKK